jgi:hypothetical protein
MWRRHPFYNDVHSFFQSDDDYVVQALHDADPRSDKNREALPRIDSRAGGPGESTHHRVERGDVFFLALKNVQ